ncbi:hypothetical protein HQ587_07585 [bacterium]|nr:hypothetical protein [bacterium]
MRDIQKNISLFNILLCVNLAFISVAGAWTFPQDFDYSYYSDALVDAGYSWQINSTFHPFNYQLFDSSKADYEISGAFSWMYDYLNDHANLVDNQHNKSSDDLNIIFMPGMGIAGQAGAASSYNHVALQPFIWTEAHFRANWYARLYFRATNKAESLPHFTGVKQAISRAGFDTGEIDQSIIGYQNDWAQVEFGRGREIWGPFAEDNLLLAGNAPAWERLMLQFNYRGFTYRWFFGYLETVVSPDDDNVNRYIVGRALEYSNKRNVVISAGEVSTLAGVDRPPDWSFLNPIAVHLEAEQNNRENSALNNDSNVILFLNIDWLMIPTLRLTGAFLLDDIQIDREDRDAGDADALGYTGRFAWTPVHKPVGITLFGYYSRIDTYSLQHSYGYANLVTRGKMIGHPMGNDADDRAFGVRLTFSQPLLLEFKIGNRRWGDNSMLNDPYTGYTIPEQKPFPSGNIRENRYLALRVRSNSLKHLSLAVDGQFDLHNAGEGSDLETWTFTLRYQLPLLWKSESR